jgi:hypothetical protein
MSHVTARLLVVVVLLLSAPAAVAATAPGHEHTGIVNLSGQSGTPSSTPSTSAAPVASAPAPVAEPHVTGTDGLPYTGGSPILGAFAGIGLLLLGVGLRMRYGSPFRAFA